jgi:hypothetical protein
MGECNEIGRQEISRQGGWFVTIREWNRLKPGDVIVNKRSAGIDLTVIKIDADAVTVKAPHGEFVVREWAHFVPRFPQTVLPLRARRTV